jgi:hypothetical protein
MNSRLFVLAVCAGLCACASSPPGEEAAVPRGRVNVFISPMGEPFRGGSDAAYPIDGWFSRVDANHDGALTEDEFVTDAVTFFRKLDLNHDGVLDGAEISAYEQDVAPEILPRIARLTAKDIPPLPSNDPQENQKREAEDQARQEAGSGEETRPRAPLMAGAAVFGVTHEPEPVAAADTDFDGKVSLDEWKAAARRRFELLDVDHDGRIARSELPKTPAEKLAEKAARRERHDHRPPDQEQSAQR